MKKQKAKALALVVLVLVILVILGSMDYEDEVAAGEHYCKMVRDGGWPDYKGIYEEACL